jgi:hypothetical protein
MYCFSLGSIFEETGSRDHSAQTCCREQEIERERVRKRENEKERESEREREREKV